MKDTDIEEFTKALVITAALLKESTTPEILKMYFEILKKFELVDIKKALIQHVETSKFFPKPAEIITLLIPPENPDDRANKAWLVLLRAINKHGYYDSVQFEDKVIHSCIRAMGGWMQVSDREPDTWMHKDFVNFYKAYSQGYMMQSESICGMIEKQNGWANLAYIPNDAETKVVQQLKPGQMAKPISGINQIGNVLKLGKTGG